MAVSQIEERILGRLACRKEEPAPLLAASLYQVLGLSIMLSRQLIKARRLRRLDTTRDTKSLELYYHIIWLAREGLSITEEQILTECQNGQQGAECRVMAAKLRASLYHVVCLFHNHPPVSQFMTQSPESRTSPASALSAKNANAQARPSPPRKSPPHNGKENGNESRRAGKSALRDPIPSMMSDASYVTNPYAFNNAQSPLPPSGPPPPIPPEARRTPSHPPGLAPLNISSTQAAASFLLPPMNFVPMARESFQTAQDLANSTLPPTNALRLSITLEHCAFLWDCCKDARAARHLARQTIKEVYASSEGLDDEEFADASVLVQSLGGVVRKGDSQGDSQGNSPPHVAAQDLLSRTTMATGQGEETAEQGQQQQSQQRAESSQSKADASTSTTSAPPSFPPPIDRAIALSPTNNRNQPGDFPPASAQQSQIYVNNQTQPPQTLPRISSPERLSTVLELSSEDDGEVGRGVTDAQGDNSVGQSKPGSPFFTLSPPPQPASASRNRVRTRKSGSSSPGTSASSSSVTAGGGGGGGGAAAGADKAGKRQAVEQAEEIYRRTRGARSEEGSLGSGFIRGGGEGVISEGGGSSTRAVQGQSRSGNDHSTQRSG